MNTKRNKLLTKFGKLEKLDYSTYKTLLKSLCQYFHVDEVNVNKLVDKLLRPEYSEDFKRVLKKLNYEIELNEIYLKFIEDLGEQKNSDQGLSL